MTGRPLHLGAVAAHGPQGWRGVLIAGPSGSGKSDLALRLMGRGWRLVADDYCHVWASGGRLYARAPVTIADRIEARGLGIVSAGALALAPVVLLVEAAGGPVERLPEPVSRRIDGIALPVLTLDLRLASTVDLVAVAVARLSSPAALA